MATKIGMLQALTGSIGEADTEIGGLYQTRLTSAVGLGTNLVAVLTWNGTTTVTTPSTSEVTVGDWIRLNSDGQYFEIESIVANTSITILNPYSKGIPTGATTSAKAVMSFPVETTLDWDAVGKIGIEGVIYRYTSKTNTSFDGITYLLEGEVMPGPYKLHRIQSTVLDQNHSRSAVDKARQSILVDYAEGDYLNALARNLGVLRLPFLSDDANFRRIVKALAYNPKGTLLGIQLALEAMLGVGNFEIYEDLIRYPNTVFIRLLGSASTFNKSEGKAFMPTVDNLLCANPLSIALAHNVVSKGVVHLARWKPENILTDCRIAYPSADLVSEYDGAASSTVWGLIGTGLEGTNIVLDTVDYSTEFTAPTIEARYHRPLRISNKAIARFDIVCTITSSAVSELMPHYALNLGDGTRHMTVAIQPATAVKFNAGFAPELTGPYTWIGGTPIVGGLQRGTYYTIGLEKDRDSNWNLYINGELKGSLPYSAGTISNTNHARFGFSGNPGALSKLRIKQISAWVDDVFDFGSIHETTGTITNPDQFLAGTYVFQANDVGKRIILRNSAITNPGGGNNNGRWLITTLGGGSLVTVGGLPQINAITQTANPLRITVPVAGQQFKFPDDLGKQIQITDSELGNNGTYTINKLLDPLTLVDLSTWSTKVPIETNVCEVTAATFVSETELGWKLLPTFTNEPNVIWEMAGATDAVGNILSLRQSLPVSPYDPAFLKVLEITYSDVLSATVLANEDIHNVVTQLSPLLFAYYPAYLADPLGFVRTYLQDITAAGVIPEFLYE